jgi:GNAT superfamily N-acetyltransferase
MSDTRIASAADVPWDDVAAVFGTRGDPAGCWCQWWKLANAEFRAASRAELCDALHTQARSSATSPGVLAYRDDVPVGWCAVEPRPRYVRIRRSTVLGRSLADQDLDDAGVWSVVCFVVPRAHRGQGLMRALLAGAVELARSGGARSVEGYPVVVGERRMASADLYHGTLGAFEDAGFAVVGRPSPTRAVVRLDL